MGWAQGMEVPNRPSQTIGRAPEGEVQPYGGLRSGANEATRPTCGDSGLGNSTSLSLLKPEPNLTGPSGQSHSLTTSSRESSPKVKPPMVPVSSESTSTSPQMTQAPSVAPLPWPWLVPWTVGTPLPLPPADPLSMKPIFDGDPEKVVFFLNQVWAHLKCYAPAYPLDMVMVNAIAANLEGDSTV